MTTCKSQLQKAVAILLHTEVELQNVPVNIDFLHKRLKPSLCALTVGIKECDYLALTQLSAYNDKDTTKHQWLCGRGGAIVSQLPFNFGMQIPHIGGIQGQN